MALINTHLLDASTERTLCGQNAQIVLLVEDDALPTCPTCLDQVVEDMDNEIELDDEAGL